MSKTEQEHALSLISQLLAKKGVWLYLSIPIAIASALAAIIAIFTYNFAAVSYLKGVDYAKNEVPAIVVAVRDVERSLNSKEGYAFHLLQ